ncbi:MAG: VOC family protein [Firmicutes bacterium]|nr:VOC family protein [Bacillota bacterium]
MSFRVVHWEIMGKDPTRLREFYQALFGWTFEVVPQFDYALTGPQESAVSGGIGKDETPKVIIYVEVPDLEETLRRAESLGGQVALPPTEVPGGPTLAVFTDPEGNHIGLIKAVG